MGKDRQLATAEGYVAEGKYDKALKVLEKLAAKDPDDLRLQLKLADVYVRQKAIAKAMETYQTVASIYEKERFHLKAIAIYKLMLKMNPTLINVNVRLGDLYTEVGLRQDAISQYHIVSNHYEQLSDTEHLLEIRKKIVDADPNAVTSRIRLAEVYQKSGLADASLQEYEQVADQLREQSNKAGLAEVYQKLLFYKPDQPKLLVELCQIYVEKGDPGKAIERIEAADKVMQQDPDLRELAVSAYLQLEQRENARRNLRELYQWCGENSDGVRAGRLYAVAEREFEDDIEYLEELDQMRKESGLQHTQAPPAEAGAPSQATPSEPADLDKTTIMRVDDLPATPETAKPAPLRPAASEPAAPPRPAQKAPAPTDRPVDLEATVVVREEDLKPKPAAKPAEPEEDIKDLEATVMVDLAEFEKYMKEKKS